jgi:hypothetical protein
VYSAEKKTLLNTPEYKYYSRFNFFFYIFVKLNGFCIFSLFISLCGNSILFSSYKMLWSYFLGRPIAGHANLCPQSISTKPQELEILLSTVKHEILHALGFSVSLYAFYRDEEGNPLTPRGDSGKPHLNEK